MINRKVTYRLYPSKKQAECLLILLEHHQRVYNAALEERIRCYREQHTALTFADQCKALTRWRQKYSCLREINAQSLQVTLKRLDLAYQSFFRRVKAGETPGFPRFKSISHFSGWGYKTHGDGWRLLPGEKMQHGRIRLSGVGLIAVRGQARAVGNPKTCEIMHKSGKWYASITVECEARRSAGTKAVGMDWGLEKFVVLHDSKGSTKQIDNPRHLKSMLSTLKTLQKSVSRKKNKVSKTRKKAISILARQHIKIANRRKNFHHQLAAKIVQEHGLIAVESLSIKNMTAKGGSYKKGLNREILSAAPSQFHSLLKSKAEEAGAIWIEIPTKKVKPSQTCYQCGMQLKKTLQERWHACECGASCDRDENAARVILNWALKWASGQELAEVRSRGGFTTLSHETPAIS